MAKISKLRARFQNACIAEFYTLNGWFLKVYPAFDIDKVKFAFVEKGTNGSGFDVHVNVGTFSLLCDDIQNYRLAKMIAAETSQYPTAWNYVTGENGSKGVAIGKSSGKSAMLIQGRLNKTFARVPVATYEEMREMAMWFDYIAGKKPCSGYIKKMVDVFWNAHEVAASYHKGSEIPDDEPNIPDDEPERRGQNSSAQASRQESSSAQTTRQAPAGAKAQSNGSAPSMQTQAAAKAKPAAQPAVSSRIGQFRSHSRIGWDDMRKRYYMTASMAGSNSTVTLFISTETVEEINRKNAALFSKFKSALESGERTFAAQYEEREGGLEFKSFAAS